MLKKVNNSYNDDICSPTDLEVVDWLSSLYQFSWLHLQKLKSIISKININSHITDSLICSLMRQSTCYSYYTSLVRQCQSVMIIMLAVEQSIYVFAKMVRFTMHLLASTLRETSLYTLLSRRYLCQSDVIIFLILWIPSW